MSFTVYSFYNCNLNKTSKIIVENLGQLSKFEMIREFKKVILQEGWALTDTIEAFDCFQEYDNEMPTFVYYNGNNVVIKDNFRCEYILFNDKVKKCINLGPDFNFLDNKEKVRQMREFAQLNKWDMDDNIYAETDRSGMPIFTLKKFSRIVAS